MNMNGWHTVRCILLLMAIVSTLNLAGCGAEAPTGDVVETVAASGVLTYQGRPLEFHQVTVMPENDRPAMGISDESGRFVLGTNDQGDGAVAGVHRIAVTYVGPPNTNPGEGVMEFTPPPPPKVTIDKKYSNPETSGLTVEIPDGGTDALQVDLQ